MRARNISLHHNTVRMLVHLMRGAEIDGEYRVANRIHAVLLNADGKTSGEISHILRSPRSRVSDWLKNYDEFGLDGLLEGQRSGRPAGLSEQQKEEIADIIESGPVAYGFVSGVWTAILIAEVIYEEFGITYDPRHVRRILEQMDFSVQRPRRMLAKADPEKQSKWRRYTYPNIKKKRGQKAPL